MKEKKTRKFAMQKFFIIIFIHIQAHLRHQVYFLETRIDDDDFGSFLNGWKIFNDFLEDLNVFCVFAVCFGSVSGNTSLFII